MAITYDIDLLKSTFTRGVSSNLHDRAQRRAIVRGLTNAAQPNNTDFQDAIDHLIASEGTVHFGDTSLPLAHVSVTRFGPTKLLAVLDYRRRQTGSVPTSPPQVIAKFRSTFRSVEWYRTTEEYHSDGYPFGNMIFVKGNANTASANAIPRTWVWQQPAFAVHVPLFLNFNPASNVAFLLGKVNSGTVTFGDNGFAPGTLRFDGLDVDWLGTPQGDFFNVLYSFTHVRGGFWRQFSLEPDAAGPWDTVEFPEYEFGSFAVFT
jgi:hypothetical protein